MLEASSQILHPFARLLIKYNPEHGKVAPNKKDKTKEKTIQHSLLYPDNIKTTLLYLDLIIFTNSK